MTDTLKVLGQAYPAAGSLATLYTVPAATSATVSTVTACNQGAGAAKFRVSVAVAGAADTQAQYLYFDQPVAAKGTFAFTIGVTLAATDVVRCYSDTGTVSFNAFGVQLT